MTEARREDAELTLYLFEASNACVTAMRMLEHKRLGYRAVRIPPAAHAFAVLALGFRGRTVPALRIGRRRVQGTREIARALDELSPDPPLLPPDPALRRRVEEAERRGEQLQDATRRMFYVAARRAPSTFDSAVLPGFGPRTAAVLRVARPLIVALASLAHRASTRAVRADLAELPRCLEQIRDWIEEGVLDGERLNAADFQIAANTRALGLFEDLAPLLDERVAAHALRVVPRYAGHVPPVFPTAWLEPLAAARARDREPAVAR